MRAPTFLIAVVVPTVLQHVATTGGNTHHVTGTRHAHHLPSAPVTQASDHHALYLRLYMHLPEGYNTRLLFAQHSSTTLMHDTGAYWLAKSRSSRTAWLVAEWCPRSERGPPLAPGCASARQGPCPSFFHSLFSTAAPSKTSTADGTLYGASSKEQLVTLSSCKLATQPAPNPRDQEAMPAARWPHECRRACARAWSGRFARRHLRSRKPQPQRSPSDACSRTRPAGSVQRRCRHSPLLSGCHARGKRQEGALCDGGSSNALSSVHGSTQAHGWWHWSQAEACGCACGSASATGHGSCAAAGAPCCWIPQSAIRHQQGLDWRHCRQRAAGAAGRACAVA